jgi:hypothetical protein
MLLCRSMDDEEDLLADAILKGRLDGEMIRQMRLHESTMVGDGWWMSGCREHKLDSGNTCICIVREGSVSVRPSMAFVRPMLRLPKV